MSFDPAAASPRGSRDPDARGSGLDRREAGGGGQRGAGGRPDELARRERENPVRLPRAADIRTRGDPDGSRQYEDMPFEQLVHSARQWAEGRIGREVAPAPPRIAFDFHGVLEVRMQAPDQWQSCVRLLRALRVVPIVVSYIGDPETARNEQQRRLSLERRRNVMPFLTTEVFSRYSVRQCDLEGQHVHADYGDVLVYIVPTKTSFQGMREFVDVRAGGKFPALMRHQCPALIDDSDPVLDDVAAQGAAVYKCSQLDGGVYKCVRLIAEDLMSGVLPVHADMRS